MLLGQQSMGSNPHHDKVLNCSSLHYCCNLQARMQHAVQVFAYGQTGAGKTYVMGTAATNDQIASPREENGVIPRGITYLFSKMAALRQDHLVSLKVRD